MDCGLLIIGAGQAAAPLARAAAQAGLSVVVAERAEPGGSCINFGCTPTKAAIASAKLAHQARRGSDYGLRIPEVEVDFSAVLARARHIVEEKRSSLRQTLEETEQLRLLHGHARLTGRDDGRFHADVEGQHIRAAQVVLDTGSRSAVPPIEGLDQVDLLLPENWLDRPELPQRLVVIGGGYIGLEMAQLYARLGSEVLVVESGSQIAGGEDEDVAAALQKLLARDGIRFRLNGRAVRVEQDGELHLHLEDGREIAATHLFLATGREPNSDDLGLEKVGVERDARGFLRVDERLATPVPGLWAAGDLRGGAMFTHTSWDDNRVLQSQLLGDGGRTTERLEPYAIFTDPQLGRVGLSERDARQDGRRYRCATFPFDANGKAKVNGEPEGFIKLLSDADDGQLLGAAVLGAEGAELVHLYGMIMAAGLRPDVLDRAVHIHPTLAEAVQSAAAALAA